MFAFITGMIVGVPISLVSIRLLSTTSDTQQEVLVIDAKIDSLITKMDDVVKETNRLTVKS
mgnify:CR=1 FL=1